MSAHARRQRKALLVTSPAPLRALLRRGTWLAQAQAWAALVAAPTDPVEHRATGGALRLAAYQEAKQLGKELRTVVQALAPALLAQPGRAGHRRAAADQLVAPGSATLGGRACHAGRRRPIPAPSGQVLRYRAGTGS